jgi:hypothetical protein
MAGVEQLVDLSYGIQGAALWPIGVVFRLQVVRYIGSMGSSGSKNPSSPM